MEEQQQAKEQIMNDLMKRQTVTDMVAEYDIAISEIDNAFSLLNSATSRLDVAFRIGRLNNGLRGIQSVIIPDSPDRIKSNLLKEVWSYAIKQTGLMQILTQAKSEELRKQLGEGRMPPFTVDNVMSTFKNFSDNINTFTDEVVKEAFDILRPRYDRFKTNSQYEIGEKIILERFIDYTKYTDRFDVCGYYEASIRTIDNVFHLMDGKGAAKAPYDLLTALRVSCKHSDLHGETNYFKFKIFKKGTLHLTVKNPALLDMLNQKAGGSRLSK